MSQKFARFVPAKKRSLALRAFNSHETEINEHFWSFKVIAEYSSYIARTAHKEDAKNPTAEVFKASGPDARRIPQTVSGWLRASKNLENWLRLSAVVSASSYLEVYIRAIVRTALMSDPLCRFGAPRALDGTKLLKLGKEVPYQHEVEILTRGDWTTRCKNFKQIFGGIPDCLEKNISILDRIRNVRNDFAHGFGRDLAVPLPSAVNSEPSCRISQTSLIKMMGTLSKTASAIDEFLLFGFIGAFEPIHYYHTWLLKPKDQRDVVFDGVRAVQRSFNRDFKYVLSQQFCAGLIEYYKKI